MRKRYQKNELLENESLQELVNPAALGKPLSFLYIVIPCESSMLLFLAFLKINWQKLCDGYKYCTALFASNILHRKRQPYLHERPCFVLLQIELGRMKQGRKCNWVEFISVTQSRRECLTSWISPLPCYGQLRWFNNYSNSFCFQQNRHAQGKNDYSVNKNRKLIHPAIFVSVLKFSWIWMRRCWNRDVLQATILSVNMYVHCIRVSKSHTFLIDCTKLTNIRYWLK